MDWSRGSSVGVASSYMPGDPGFEFRWGGGKIFFSSPKTLQTKPNLICSRYRDSFPGVKTPKREANRSSHSSVQVENKWSYTSIPPVCLHGVERVTLPLPSCVGICRKIIGLLCGQWLAANCVQNWVVMWPVTGWKLCTEFCFFYKKWKKIFVQWEYMVGG